MNLKRIRLLVCTLALGLSAQSAAWACPLCKVAVENDDKQPMAYMVSILFMLGMIMSLFFGVGVLAWWINRNERRALQAAGYGHLFENAVNQPPESNVSAT